MKRVILAVILLIGVNLAACTCVTVKRAEKGTEAGLRYYLPQPIIIVTPQEDGTTEVRVESIADRNQAYSVSAKSWLASYKLVLKQNQGLLTEVSWTSDSSAVAAESVKAAGEVKKSKIDAETEASKKAFDKKEAAAKEQRDEMKKLQDTLADAKVEAAQTAAAVEALKESNDQTKTQDAAIAKAKADAKVTELEKRVTDLGQVGTGGFSIVEETGKKLQDSLEKAQLEAAQAATAIEALRESNDEKAKAEAAKRKEKADAQVNELKNRAEAAKAKKPKSAEAEFKRNKRPGPVLLLIKEDAKSGGIELVPVNFDNEPQKMFASYERPSKATDEKSTKITKLEFEKSEIDLQLSSTSGKTDITMKNEFVGLMVVDMTGSQEKIDAGRWPKVTPKNSKTFELEFKGNIAPDVYTIKFSGRENEDSPPVEGEIKVKVTP